MKRSAAVAITLVAILGLTLVGVFGAAVLDLRQDDVTRDLWTWVGRTWTGLCGVLPLVILAGMIYGLWQLLTGLRIRANLVHHRDGQLPASANPKITIHAPHRNLQAEVAKAAVSGPGRISAGALRATLAPPPKPLQLPAPLTNNFDIGKLLADYNPETQPHYMLIGETGSGKSSAVFALTDHIARHFNSQFLIAEKDAVDWNLQTDARTLAGYVSLLEAAVLENTRRTQLLRTANVSHIIYLPEHLPLLVIVLEETESIYQRLFELDQREAKRFRANLRDLAGGGRKQGVALIVATQTGSKEVFDIPTRNNLGNILVFRSQPMVGDWYSVPRAVGIQGLPSGTAYAPRYERLITFPRISRPQLPNAGIYHEPEELLLAADATADGVGDDDLPDGTWYSPEEEPPPVPVYPGIQYRVPGKEAPLTDYDEALHRRLWAILQAGSSLKGAQAQAEMKYQGGTGFYLVRRIQELGEQGTLPWMVSE